MSRTPQSRCYLIDIEGVLVRDKRYEPVPGSVAWFNGLGDKGCGRILVSNNTTHAPEDLASALRGVGFAVAPEDLVTALAVGARLLEGWGKTRILWLGSPGMADWWREAGFTLVTGGRCDAVVLGANPDLGPSDLQGALAALLDHDAELVALHRNMFYLDGRGERRFGPGFACAGLSGVARRDPVVVGKPQERIYRQALEKIGGRAEEALFISDDPVNDLVTAKKLGMTTAFVLSGKYPDHAVLGRMDQQDWPDIIADTPAAIDAAESGTGGATMDGE
ncbi:HAD-IIA family hydrolase [bacterium]|nr:HAD-IIA family hydrolase [bacterium]MBU1072047.1 HAD-IIA family hydrolase [bacterium]MBU1676277.1 HAD-IIA family hydrolase [bacterium]